MVRYVKARKSKVEVLAKFEPLISEWFDGRFADLTPPQAIAVPLIHAGKNVLVSSPTGSGKTLTAFLSILNDLFRRAAAGRLEGGVQALYISPLKALANDIDRNLKQPLAEMEALAAERGWERRGHLCSRVQSCVACITASCAWGRASWPWAAWKARSLPATSS